MPALEADLTRLRHLAVDGAGNLYLVESGRHRIRKISSQGIITTVAGKGTPGFSGDGGPATEAELSNPVGLALDRADTLYIVDAGNASVRAVAADGTISTVVRFEVPSAAAPANMGAIQAVTLDETGALYVAHQKQVHRIWPAEPLVDSPIAGGNTTRGPDDVPATEAIVWSPAAAVADSRGNLYVLEPENYRVRLVTPDGTISTFAGGVAGFSGDGGPATQAGLTYPQSIAVDRRGNLYIADPQANRIRRVSPGGIITTFAGSGRPGPAGDGGPAVDAALTWPTSVAVDQAGSVYFLDNFAQRLRRVSPDGIITGLGIPVFLEGANVVTRAVALAIDTAGRPLLAYAAAVLRAQTDTQFTRIAGDGVPGWSGDGGPATQARFANLGSLWVDASGAIILADTANHRVRKLTPEAPAAAAAAP